MAPFKKILVPIDFSRHSERAAQLAAELVGKFGAQVTLLHVYNIPTYPLPEGFVLASPQTVVELMERINDEVKRAKAGLLARGVTAVDTLLVEGSAHAEIVRVARQKGFDLIVMGTHGRTGFQHAFMGSVAEKVVRKASCPVLTVRDPEEVAAASSETR
jgi:nucleotide-binding universal stress UspA family protein